MVLLSRTGNNPISIYNDINELNTLSTHNGTLYQGKLSSLDLYIVASKDFKNITYSKNGKKHKTVYNTEYCKKLKTLKDKR